MKSALSNLRIRVPAAAAGFLLVLAGSSVVRGQATDTKLRWDLIVVTFRAPAAPNILSPGGADSATATDIAGNPRLRITLTGSGTFSQWDPTDVTGGLQAVNRRIASHEADNSAFHARIEAEPVNKMQVETRRGEAGA